MCSFRSRTSCKKIHENMWSNLEPLVYPFKLWLCIDLFGNCKEQVCKRFATETSVLSIVLTTIHPKRNWKISRHEHQVRNLDTCYLFRSSVFQGNQRQHCGQLGAKQYVRIWSWNLLQSFFPKIFSINYENIKLLVKFVISSQFTISPFKLFIVLRACHG